MNIRKLKNTITKEKDKVGQFIFKLSITFFVAIVFIICFFSFKGLDVFEKSCFVDKFKGYDFQLHVIDVENGDAFLLKLPDNKTMLIDCGDSEYEDRVISYIRQFLKTENLSQIDYFVFTHCDSDHIGNASKIIETFDVKNVYRPKVYSIDENNYINVNRGYSMDSSSLYNKAIISAYKNNCNIFFNEEGINIALDNCNIEFLSPALEYYNDDNDYSAVLLIKYFSKKLLFMGDATNEIEQTLIKKYGNYLHSDILKVGHHGSKTSSCEEFLNMVNPEIAILSCSDNSTILPSNEVVAKLKSKNINVLSTMESENFAITIAENSIDFQVQQRQFNYWAIIFVLLTIIAIVMFKVDFSHNKHMKKGKNLLN